MWLSPIAYALTLVGMMLTLVGIIKSAVDYDRIATYSKALEYYIVKKEGKMPNKDIMWDCYCAVRYVDKKRGRERGKPE